MRKGLHSKIILYSNDMHAFWCLAGDWLRWKHWLRDGSRGERAGLLDGHAGPLECLLFPSVFIPLLQLGNQRFSCRLRRLRIRQREAGTKEAFHTPCNCFQISLCCHGTGTYSMPTLPLARYAFVSPRHSTHAGRAD